MDPIIYNFITSARSALTAALAACVIFFAAAAAFAQSQFEGKTVGQITVTLADETQNDLNSSEFWQLARNAIGERYEAVSIRDAIDRIYSTRQVVSVVAEAVNTADGRVDLNFVIKRKSRLQQLVIEIVDPENNKFTEQELFVKLNVVEPGTPISEQILSTNANQILEYLRDQGFYRAEVTFEQRPSATVAETSVVYKVRSGEQSTVETFDINIDGFDKANAESRIKLRPGEPYSRDKLTKDLDRIRDALRKEGRFAPQLNEPRVRYERESNKIFIELTGKQGPQIEVVIDAEKESVGERTQTRLLPIRREGTLDFAAIIEGERRLENYFQEQGYFFADVSSVCSVEPALTDDDDNPLRNESEYICSSLSSSDLENRKVTVRYKADLNRRLKLVGIRLRGTDQFTIEEITSVLESQEASILGIIPLLGYGRGYTSQRLLEEDAATIVSLLRELGYRNASVRVNQGVSPDGENLIITFVVDQGEPTIVTGVDIVGNAAFSDDELRRQIPDLVGTKFSRARLRNAQRSLAEFYSNAGYYDATVRYSIEREAASTPDPSDDDDPSLAFKIRFIVENEGKKVVVNRVMIAGNEHTKTAAIRRALAIEPGDLLRAADIYQSEQSLYSSDVFSRVEIKPRAEADRPDGTRAADVLVNVTEQAPRILSYGGGFSTDFGASGFVDIRHFNLFGRLWQGGARVKLSQRQQLAQIDYVNPRFIRDWNRNYAPLTISAQYQRDSTVTRFFRSSFDRGTFGIVQRLDEDGNPIDEFGRDVGSPTLHRLTLSAETNRTIRKKDRSILFFRYRFEDVRLYNVGSLLIKDLLIPDSRIRISGFGTNFVRDTRKRCGIEYSILEIIARGEPGAPCRYNAGDPTDGDYLTAEYNVSLPTLGANIGFSKFQLSYQRYHTFNFLNKTTLAARVIFGGANVFSSKNRYDPLRFPGMEDVLPISERFFAGGSNTLRGFDFESAGPRYVVVPQGTFRNSDGEQVFLTPFSVPFGGNAIAITNLEARIPIGKSLRVVPFYDGGNVFRRVRDIFKPADVPAGDVFGRNMRALWTHTVGLGLRLKTPIGGEIGVDYGYLLNPPEFLIPQPSGPPAIHRLSPGHLHFRFSQAF